MSYIGDFALGKTFDTKFCTVGTTGAPTVLAGSPVISAYVDNSLTQITAGITLSVDFDGVVGLNNIRVVATSGNGYAAGSNYQLVITTGTVGGTSVVGYVVAEFSIEARSSLRPTTADRTLDVSAGGEAGLDWANVGSPTTAQNLSSTNIDVDQVVASVSGAVGSVAAGGITAASIATDAIDADALADGAITAATFAAGAINAAAIATDAITAAKIAADAVTEIQSGLATAAALDTVDNLLDTEIADIQARLPAALTADGNIKADALRLGGTLQTGRDIGASVLLSSGTGTGQLDFASGVVKANLAQILGTALTETAGLLAAGFKKFFNVALPTGTVNSLPDAVAGAAGGVFIAGSNAATSTALTANITGNITGNLSGSVGSVTGNVGGNVVGSVASVTGAVGSVAAGGIAATTFAAGAIDAAAIASNAITSGKIATDAIGAAQIAADAIGSSELAMTAITEIQTGLSTLTAADVNAEVVDVLRTDTIPDSYAADGAQPTFAQAILAIQQFLTEKNVVGTTVTVKKPNGSTSAMTFTLDSATAPTSITRAS